MHVTKWAVKLWPGQQILVDAQTDGILLAPLDQAAHLRIAIGREILLLSFYRCSAPSAYPIGITTILFIELSGGLFIFQGFIENMCTPNPLHGYMIWVSTLLRLAILL